MIKGDENHQEIAAALIVNIFVISLCLNMRKNMKDYFFEENKGYPTKDHKNAINYLGLSNIHRKSFKI